MGRRLNVSVDFSKRKELSYIYGVYRGDGNLNKRRNTKGIIVPSIFRLHVSDRDFAENVYRVLEQIGLKPIIRRTKASGLSKTMMWIVTASSIDFYEWLASFSKDFKSFPSVIHDYPLDFVQGVYESEGYCWYLGRWKEVDGVLKRTSLKVEIGMGDKYCLYMVADILHHYGFNVSLSERIPDRSLSGASVTTRILFHRLRIYGGTVENQRFLDIINPCIKESPTNYKLISSQAKGTPLEGSETTGEVESS